MPGTITHLWIHQRAMCSGGEGGPEGTSFAQEYLTQLGEPRPDDTAQRKFIRGFLERLRDDYPKLKEKLQCGKSPKSTDWANRNPKDAAKKAKKLRKKAEEAKKKAKAARRKADEAKNKKDKAKKNEEAEKREAEAAAAEKAAVEAERDVRQGRKLDTDGVLASYGYLGCTGPDMFSVPPSLSHPKLETNALSAFAHYNKTGALVIHCLAQLKARISKDVQADDEPAALECQLAYWLGHITHLAADIVTHPYVNSRAGALQTLEKKFAANQKSTGAKLAKIFKTHNTIEQYQDAYVKYELFKAGERYKDWTKINYPSAAALHLRQKPARQFIGKSFDDFYKQKLGDKQDYDKRGHKYEYCRLWFFLDDKKSNPLSLRSYCVNTIASRTQCTELLEETIGEDEFKKHIKASTDLSRIMMREALDYLVAAEPAAKDQDEDVYAAKQAGFKWLQMNWNIDSGHGFDFEEVPIELVRSPAGPYWKLLRVHVRTYPSGNVALPAEPVVAQDENNGAGVRHEDTTWDGLTPRWCVQVVPQALVRKDHEAGLDVWVAPAGEGDAEEVGKVIGEKVRSRGSGENQKQEADGIDRARWWESEKLNTAGVPALCTGSESQGYALLAFGKPRRQEKQSKAFEETSREKRAAPKMEQQENGSWNDLLNRMVVLTPTRKGVWDVTGQNGRYNKKSYKLYESLHPTEQVFLKFHIFRDYGKAELDCDDQAGIRGWEDVPLQARIHHISLEIGFVGKGLQQKVLRAWLDGDRMIIRPTS
jgi:hypothetical protein